MLTHSKTALKMLLKYYKVKISLNIQMKTRTSKLKTIAKKLTNLLLTILAIQIS